MITISIQNPRFFKHGSKVLFARFLDNLSLCTFPSSHGKAHNFSHIILFVNISSILYDMTMLAIRKITKNYLPKPIDINSTKSNKKG